MTGAISVTLRAMAAADIPAVHRIELEAFSHPWTHTMFQGEIENPLGWCRVAAGDHDAVVGFIVARFYGDLWHLMDLAVASGERRRGVGGRLLDDFLRVATGTGVAVTLEVRESNAAARRLYAGRGFDEVGRRRGYYPENGEDAVVMTWWPSGTSTEGRG